MAGSRSQNLTIAEGCFRQAIEICPAEVDAYPYAQALANLGAVLGESDELATVLRGIELIEESLTLTDQSAADFGLNLLEEAKLHICAHELGADGHVTAALAAVESAMQLPAIQQVPSYLAAALVCYGSVVLRSPVLPADAEDMLRRAVEVADVLPVRRESAATARLYLGRFYMARGDLAAARSNLSGAIQDFEADVGPETGVEERTAVERRVSEAYTALIDVLVALGEPKAAFDCLERSKARTLGDMIAAREILPGSGVPATLVEDYIQLRERQRYAEKRAQMMRFGSRPDAQESRPGQSDYVIRMADVEVAMHQQMLADLEPRLAAVVQAIQAHDPAFTPAPRHAPLALADIQHLLAPDRAIVELLLAEHRTYLFVLTPGSEDEATLTVFEAPRANRADVRALVQSGWLEPYQRYRSAALSGSPQLKKLRAEWQSAIASLGPRLAELLDFAEVSRFLARTQIKDIIFVPYQLFHILPLHLLPGDRGGYLCDEYAISYAPSLEILKACHHRAHRGRSSGLLVENPDGSLDYSALEVGLVRSFLQRSQRLAGDDCRWEDVQRALPGTEIFHYSGHAYFDLRSPLNSALMLADRR